MTNPKTVADLHGMKIGDTFEVEKIFDPNVGVLVTKGTRVIGGVLYQTWSEHGVYAVFVSFKEIEG